MIYLLGGGGCKKHDFPQKHSLPPYHVVDKYEERIYNFPPTNFFTIYLDGETLKPSGVIFNENYNNGSVANPQNPYHRIFDPIPIEGVPRRVPVMVEYADGSTNAARFYLEGGMGWGTSDPPTIIGTPTFSRPPAHYKVHVPPTRGGTNNPPTKITIYKPYQEKE